jgi:hypothetical protein
VRVCDEYSGKYGSTIRMRKNLILLEIDFDEKKEAKRHV